MSSEVVRIRKEHESGPCQVPEIAWDNAKNLSGCLTAGFQVWAFPLTSRW